MSYEPGLFNGWIFSLVFILCALPLGMLGRKEHRGETFRLWEQAGVDDRLVMGSFAAVTTALALLPVWLPLWFGTPRLDWGAGVSILGLAGYAVSRLHYGFRKTPVPPGKGLYRFSRNPAALFFYLFWAGVAVATASRLMYLLIAVAALMGHFAITARERYLGQKLGGPYREYLEKVPRYLVFF